MKNILEELKSGSELEQDRFSEIEDMMDKIKNTSYNKWW